MAAPAFALTSEEERPARAAAKRAPDLVVTGLSHPASAVAGATLIATDAVRNRGRLAAPRTVVGYRLSRDGRLDRRDPRLTGSRRVKRLAPRKRSRGKVTLRVPAGVAAGAYRLFACADAKGKARETDERNNCHRSPRTLRVLAAPIAGPPAPTPSTTARRARRPRRPRTSTPTPTPGDTTPPDTTITSGPTGTVQATTATFAFEATEPGATFECRLDAEAFAACESPKVLTALAPGAHAFEVRALDGAGNRDASPAHAGWTVEAPDDPGGPLDPPAEDPSGQAPPLSGSAATGFADSTGFLWTGADPIQRGVAAGALKEATVAVLRGRVLNRLGGGIGGVRVTVLGHPELGRTDTRGDGRYDVAVDGGGPVTLSFERRGYITAQRQAEAPWQDFAPVDDVVLVPYDDQVSEVGLDSDAPQVARGSAVTDADGTRQATLLFRQGTQAEMVLPDGSTQELDQLHVRATEYTIGAERHRRRCRPPCRPAPATPTPSS